MSSAIRARVAEVLDVVVDKMIVCSDEKWIIGIALPETGVSFARCC